LVFSVRKGDVVAVGGYCSTVLHCGILLCFRGKQKSGQNAMHDQFLDRIMNNICCFIFGFEKEKKGQVFHGVLLLLSGLF
jgi:hypothetical protein